MTGIAFCVYSGKTNNFSLGTEKPQTEQKKPTKNIWGTMSLIKLL